MVSWERRTTSPSQPDPTVTPSLHQRGHCGVHVVTAASLPPCAPRQTNLISFYKHLAFSYQALTVQNSPLTILLGIPFPFPDSSPFLCWFSTNLPPPTSLAPPNQTHQSMLIVLYLFNLIRWRPCFGCFILCQVDFITHPTPNYALIFLKKEKKKPHTKKKKRKKTNKHRDFGFKSRS